MKRKSGRPKSAVPAEKCISFRVNNLEKILIEGYSKKCQMSISEYARTMALEGKIELYKRTFPNEAIALIGTFNHIAANLNSLAHRNNRGDFLSPNDREGLRVWLKQFIIHRNKLEEYIKNDSKSKTM